MQYMGISCGYFTCWMNGTMLKGMMKNIVNIMNAINSGNYKNTPVKM